MPPAVNPTRSSSDAIWRLSGRKTAVNLVDPTLHGGALEHLQQLGPDTEQTPLGLHDDGYLGEAGLDDLVPGDGDTFAVGGEGGQGQAVVVVEAGHVVERLRVEVDRVAEEALVDRVRVGVLQLPHEHRSVIGDHGRTRTVRPSFSGSWTSSSLG